MENAENLFEGVKIEWLTPDADVQGDETEKPAVDAVTAEATPVSDTPIEPEKPVTGTAEAEADNPPPIPQIVDDLGGEESARQFIPLVRLLQDDSIKPEEFGQKLDEALSKILTTDQASSVVWAYFDKFGSVLAEQYAEEKPNWVAAQAEKLGYTKTENESADDDEEETVDLEDMSPRERRLHERLQQLEAEATARKQQEQQSKQQQAQQSQQEVYEAAKSAMLGSVVDNVFEQDGLKDWPQEEIQRTVRIAITEFQANPEAVKNFNLGVRYQQTGQVALASAQVKARTAFQKCLGEAISLVDAKRAQTGAKTAPVMPRRTEIIDTTTTPAQQQQQQPQSVGDGIGLFDPQKLMKAVSERLASGAGR